MRKKKWRGPFILGVSQCLRGGCKMCCCNVLGKNGDEMVKEVRMQWRGRKRGGITRERERKKKEKVHSKAMEQQRYATGVDGSMKSYIQQCGVVPCLFNHACTGPTDRKILLQGCLRRKKKGGG